MKGLIAALLLIWCVGILGRGFWTPDEPREADIAWRMSWQTEKAVPVLAGEAFCEKPPLTYWLAAVPIKWFGAHGWSARLPNLLYAMITALSVGLLARRSAGALAGAVAAAAMGTFLLSYQVAIWLASDAPLLAANCVALLGLHIGFYASTRSERVRGYCLMHVALGLGFLSKNAAAVLVPALTLLTLIAWEKRWREFLRWELYVGLVIQALLILTWVWFVYIGEDGPNHLKIFFWNNLAGRFVKIDAPTNLQYAMAHRNSPGKYLIELPLYLAPWTLLVLAAIRRAWHQHSKLPADVRTLRFVVAITIPALVVLSLAATARNIYLAPALPGAALLLGWWTREIQTKAERWDIRAISSTAVILLLAILLGALAIVLLGIDGWATLSDRFGFVVISTVGLVGATYLALRAWRASRYAQILAAQIGLWFAYCTLLVGPASQAYHVIDAWQDLSALGYAVAHDTENRPLILLNPDETTRAWVDLYARTNVTLRGPHSLVLVQLPGRGLTHLAQALGQLSSQLKAKSESADFPGLNITQWRIVQRYALPNGRRYALLELRARS